MVHLSKYALRWLLPFENYLKNVNPSCKTDLDFFERETPLFYNQRIQDVKTETESLVAVLLDQSGITWQVMAHFIPSSVSACTF